MWLLCTYANVAGMYVPNAPRSPPHVYRSWCPDRTLAQARKYIADAMGARYAESVILDLEETWGESNPRTPLICFLSMGSDPTNAIEGLSKKLKLECRAISMGQRQEVHARRLLLQSMTEVGGCDQEWLFRLSGYCGNPHNFIVSLLVISTDFMVVDSLCCLFVCLYNISLCLPAYICLFVRLSVCLSVSLFCTTHVVGWMAAAPELPSRS